jgi:hypothetical protein
VGQPVEVRVFSTAPNWIGNRRLRPPIAFLEQCQEKCEAVFRPTLRTGKKPHRALFHAHAKIYRESAASVRQPGQNR